MVVKLKVLESYTRDVGRGVLRIDYDTMDSLDINTGDIVKVQGKTRWNVVKALPLYPSDEGKEICRIDGMGRNNIGIAIGDQISIVKFKATTGEKVIVTPLEAIPPIDERYLSDAMESVCMTEGDKFMVPYFGGRLTFQVLKCSPNPCIVTQKTIFSIAVKATITKTSKTTELLTDDEKIDRFNNLHRVFKATKVDIVELSDTIKSIEDENTDLKIQVNELNNKLTGSTSLLKGAQKIGKGDAVLSRINQKKLQRIQDIINE